MNGDCDENEDDADGTLSDDGLNRRDEDTVNTPPALPVGDDEQADGLAPVKPLSLAPVSADDCRRHVARLGVLDLIGDTPRQPATVNTSGIASPGTK